MCVDFYIGMHHLAKSEVVVEFFELKFEVLLKLYMVNYSIRAYTIYVKILRYIYIFCGQAIDQDFCI